MTNILRFIWVHWIGHVFEKSNARVVMVEKTTEKSDPLKNQDFVSKESWRKT